MNGGGGTEDESGSEDSDSMAQTLLEIDYETIIDDEDVIDEFCTFRNTLEGKNKINLVALCYGH